MTRELSAQELSAAAEVMAEATSHFVQPAYGEEALVALQRAGWAVTPPHLDPPDRRGPSPSLHLGEGLSCAEASTGDDAPEGGPAPDHTPADRLRPMAELSDSGVLWLINRVVFHPRGFALALHVADCGDVNGWTIQGDGAEVWTFREEVDDERFAAVEALLAEAREKNR